MPVDEFQRAVLRAIADLRTPRSPVAGGAALHQHGWRLSNDVDIFNDPGLLVPAIAAADIQVLRSRGFDVDVTKQFEGFCEAIVARGEEGSTNLQWVQYSGHNFYAPVRDEEFGCRLSMVDLAVNKVLAAASRREPRDLIDLRLVASLIPLWNALCAVPGKDASLTPRAALNMIRRNAQYGRDQIEAAAILPEGSDPAVFVRRVRKLLDAAERDLARVPRGSEGRLLVDDRGRPLGRPPGAEQTTWSTRAAIQGPVWPSGPDIDGLLIRGLVRRFGERGSKLWDARGEGSASDDPGP